MLVEVDAEVILRNFVTIPSVPSVAMNANASGTPAKFAATPEKVVSVDLIQPRRPRLTAA